MTVVDWIAMGLLISLLFTQPKRKLPTPIEWTLSERDSEGGAGQAQRWPGTGWSQVAEAPEADTDSGFMAGARKVVGVSRSLSVLSTTGSGPLEPVAPPHGGASAPLIDTDAPSPSSLDSAA